MVVRLGSPCEGVDPVRGQSLAELMLTAVSWTTARAMGLRLSRRYTHTPGHRQVAW